MFTSNSLIFRIVQPISSIFLCVDCSSWDELSKALLDTLVATVLFQLYPGKPKIAIFCERFYIIPQRLWIVVHEIPNICTSLYQKKTGLINAILRKFQWPTPPFSFERRTLLKLKTSFIPIQSVICDCHVYHVTEFLSSFIFPLFIYILWVPLFCFVSLFICMFISNRLNWERKRNSNILIKYNLLWLLVPIYSSECHRSRWSKSLVYLCVYYMFHDNNYNCSIPNFCFTMFIQFKFVLIEFANGSMHMHKW